MAFTKNPATRATGRVSNSNVVLQATPNEIAENLPTLNQIRVAHLARRFRVSPIAAGIVAGLVFGEARG